MPFGHLRKSLPWLLFFLLFCSSSQGADFSAPLIILPVDAPTEEAGVLDIRAKITDESGLESVKLYYRPIGSERDFESLPMVPLRAGDFYSATLSINSLLASGVEYYIEARDRASNISQEPFPDNPKRVQLAMTDIRADTSAGESGTKKWVWIGLGVLLTGALLTAADNDGGKEKTTLVIEAPVPGSD